MFFSCLLKFSTKKQKANRCQNQAGQVGVIVLLTMIGMLTIGLSLAARTTQESFLSGKEEETARVFNAAEQGIETALSGSLDFAGDNYTDSLEPVPGVVVNYTVEKIKRLQTRLFEAIPVGVVLDNFSPGDELRIDWSAVSDCAADDPASLIVSVFNDGSGITKVKYLALRACDRGDNFIPTSNINENGYYWRYDLALETGDFLVRIKPVYNDTEVNVYGNGFDLPVQAYNIRSEAESEETDETRIVEVDSTLLTAPAVLDYAVYSGGDLVK